MKELFNEQAIRRTLVRISHEILEKNKGCDDLCLIGILNRGDTLGKRIQAMIETIEGKSIPCGSIDITNYRDDRKVDFTLDKTSIPFSIEDKIVVLVDDVFFSGRTVRAAMEGVMKMGRPRQIQLVAFIDRGHRELPIHADYVGKNVPSSLSERIDVYLKEKDGVDTVVLRQIDEEKR